MGNSQGVSEEKSTPIEIDPRVVFAAERTLLVWIRTGLSLIGFGFVVARFLPLDRDGTDFAGGHCPSRVVFAVSPSPVRDVSGAFLANEIEDTE